MFDHACSCPCLWIEYVYACVCVLIKDKGTNFDANRMCQLRYVVSTFQDKECFSSAIW